MYMYVGSVKHSIKRMVIIVVIFVSITLLAFYVRFPIRTIERCIDGIQDDDLISGGTTTIAGHDISFGARAQRDWSDIDYPNRLRIWWGIQASNVSILNINLVHIYAFRSGTFIFPQGECWSDEATIMDTEVDTSIRGDIFNGPKWEVNTDITTVAKILVGDNAYYLQSTERIYEVQ